MHPHISYNSIKYQEPFLLLSNSDGCFRIPLQQILYCSSYNSSTEFHLSSKRRIVVSKPIIYYEKLLHAFGFVRIHHSSIINMAYVGHTSKGEETNELTLTNGQKLTVSRSKKNEVMQTLKKWSVESLFEATELPYNSKKKQVNYKNKQISHKPSSE